MSLGYSKVLDLYSDKGGADDVARLTECLEMVEAREFFPKGVGFVTAKGDSVVYVMPLVGGRMRACCPMSPVVDEVDLENVLAIGQRFVHWLDVAGLSCRVHDGVVYVCAEGSIPPCDAPYGAEMVEELVGHACAISKVATHDLAGLYRGESFMQVIGTVLGKYKELVGFMRSRIEDDEKDDK